MKNCANCGAPMNDGAKFCEACGTHNDLSADRCKKCNIPLLK